MYKFKNLAFAHIRQSDEMVSGLYLECVVDYQFDMVSIRRQSCDDFVGLNDNLKCELSWRMSGERRLLFQDKVPDLQTS